jgi:Polyketide cyclase / dehydrase and lipid transport
MVTRTRHRHPHAPWRVRGQNSRADRDYRERVIRSVRSVAAPATVVHAVLTDVRAWRLWSPHIAHVDAPEQVIEAAGWSGLVKPWFGPATRMDVTWCEPGRGIRWRSTAGRYRLDYADLIEPHDDQSCMVTMTAELRGPAGETVERVVAPLSAYGQRRRLARLAALAEYLHRWAPARI